MNKSLLFRFIAVSITLYCMSNSGYGQTIVFFENFSGFTSGTHSTPSTSDVSGSLDTKTQTLGWSGSKIYSAGGEIKLGTSELTGWLMTPLISFSGYEGKVTLKFDVCRWPGDATNIRVLLDSTQIGSSISPTDDFVTIEIPISPDITSGKIKFEALSKRFFIDNIAIVAHGATYSENSSIEPDDIDIFPNPVSDILIIQNAANYKIMEIADLSGRFFRSYRIPDAFSFELPLSDLPAGTYFLRFTSWTNSRVRCLIKCR